jgi:predicted DNA binding protein
MYKTVFRIKDDSPYTCSTARNDTRIDLWCNNHCDLLHIVGEDSEDVITHLRSEIGVRKEIENASGRTVITDSCLKEFSSEYIEVHLAANDCLLLPPLRYERGVKIVRILSLNQSDLSDLYKDISADQEVFVESKKELSTIESETPVFLADTLLPSLSDRQREAFMIAYECGYYEIPRTTSTAELADSVGVSRRTFEHHLRRAEQKLAESVVEYL